MVLPVFTSFILHGKNQLVEAVTRYRAYILETQLKSYQLHDQRAVRRAMLHTATRSPEPPTLVKLDLCQTGFP